LIASLYIKQEKFEDTKGR